MFSFFLSVHHLYMSKWVSAEAVGVTVSQEM